MRKKSRTMDSRWALEVMHKAPYITVSFIDEGMVMNNIIAMKTISSCNCRKVKLKSPSMIKPSRSEEKNHFLFSRLIGFLHYLFIR